MSHPNPCPCKDCWIRLMTGSATNNEDHERLKVKAIGLWDTAQQTLFSNHNVMHAHYSEAVQLNHQIPRIRDMSRMFTQSRSGTIVQGTAGGLVQTNTPGYAPNAASTKYPVAWAVFRYAIADTSKYNPQTEYTEFQQKMDSCLGGYETYVKMRFTRALVADAQVSAVVGQFLNTFDPMPLVEAFTVAGYPNTERKFANNVWAEERLAGIEFPSDASTDKRSKVKQAITYPAS